MLALERCTAHSAPAGWRCTACAEALCPDCVAIRTINPVELTVCTRCGEVAEELRLDRRLIEPFTSRALKGLAFPFHGIGLAGYLGMTGLLTLAWYGGSLLLFLAAAFNLAGLFAVARSAGRGDGALESVSYTGLLGSALLPVLRFAVVTFPTWAGLWLAETLHSRLLWWASIALAFLWAPISFLGAAAGTELLRLLNPFAVLGTFVRIGADARRLAVFLLAFSAVGSALEVLALRANALPVPFFSTLLWAALSVYPPYVAAHVTGLLLLLHPEPFGWDNVSLQPVLGETRPRGVAPPLAEARARPAHLQPIELPDAPRPEGPLPLPPRIDPSQHGLEPATETPIQDLSHGEQLGELPDSDPDHPEQGRGVSARSSRRFEHLGAPTEPAVARPRPTELSGDALPSLEAHARDLVLHAMKSGDAVLALETFRATPLLAAALSLIELTWVGRAAASQGDDASAERALREACAREGTPVAVSGAHVYLAKLLDERLGRSAEARALLERAQRDFPGTPGADYAAGWLARQAGSGR